MSENTQTTGTDSNETVRRPRLSYLLMFVTWTIGFPIWSVLVYVDGADKWYFPGEPIGEFFIVGSVVWFICLLGLWIVYTGIKEQKND